MIQCYYKVNPLEGSKGVHLTKAPPTGEQIIKWISRDKVRRRLSACCKFRRTYNCAYRRAIHINAWVLVLLSPHAYCCLVQLIYFWSYTYEHPTGDLRKQRFSKRWFKKTSEYSREVKIQEKEKLTRSTLCRFCNDVLVPISFIFDMMNNSLS